MEHRPRQSLGRVPEIGGGDADERTALLGPDTHNLRAAAAAAGAPSAAAASPAWLPPGRSAWLGRATSSPVLLPTSPQQQPQNHPAACPSPFAAAAPPPLTLPDASSPVSPSAAVAPGGTCPKRRYLSGSGGAAAHHHQGPPPPPYSPAAAAAAARSGSSPGRSRAYAAFLSMRRRTVVLINLVSIMERMDEQIVPALSRPLGCAFRAGPHQLGLITFARAVVQAVASPLGGLAGHFFDRVTVLFLGCAIWGFFCTCFSFATTVNQGIAAWAFNGVGLSLIIPNSQSLVADYYTATQRGEAFGTLMLTGALGGMLGTVFATNLGGLNPLGVAGWRLAFMAVGAVSLAIGAFTLLLAVDPTRHTRAAAAAASRRRTNRRHRHHRRNDRATLPAITTTTISTATGVIQGRGDAAPAHLTTGGDMGIDDFGGGGGGVPREIEADEVTEGARFQSTDPADDTEAGGGGSLPPPDSDWSGLFEGQPLLLAHKTSDGSAAAAAAAGGGGSGGGGGGMRDVVFCGHHGGGCSVVDRSPPASPAADTAALDEPNNSRRPLLRRGGAPSSGASKTAAVRPRYDDLESYQHGSTAVGAGWQSFGQHQRYSYGHGTSTECTTTSRTKSAPEVSRKADAIEVGSGGGGGVGEVVVAGCAVEGGGYESAAATAAAVLSSSREGRPVLTWGRIWQMITTPTFLIIILQGIVGSTPWNALVFLTLYLQLIGFSDATASSLMALLLGGTAAGSLVGGWLGDRVAERHPHHGRVALVQFSVGIGVPLAVVIMRGLPMSATPATAVMYGIAMLLKGVLTSWAAPACNNPVFAEIVPPDMRNLVYAFDRSFEGAISALGAPLVGMAAERWFGFSGVAGGEAACEHHNAMAGPEPDLAKARALGDAMLLFMAVPWTLCALFYTGLHWTYPRDRARALRPQIVNVVEGPSGGGRRGRAADGLPYKSLSGAGGSGGGARGGRAGV